MGHGDHWDCIKADASDEVTSFLSVATEQGEAMLGTIFGLKQNDNAYWQERGIDPETQPLGMIYDAGAFKILVVCLYQTAGDKSFWSVWTAYPILKEGLSVELTVSEISLWGNGVEAEVTGVTEDGSSISYFDSYYFRDAGKYEVGDHIRVELGAIAFGMKKAESGSFFIDDPAVIKAMRGNSPDQDLLEPIEVRLDGAAMLMPKEGWDSYEYTYHCPVRAIDQAVAFEQNFYRITATLLRGIENGIELDVPVLVSERLMEGDPPIAGDDVEGGLWLHGQYLEHVTS